MKSEKKGKGLGNNLAWDIFQYVTDMTYSNITTVQLAIWVQRQTQARIKNSKDISIHTVFEASEVD